MTGEQTSTDARAGGYAAFRDDVLRGLAASPKFVPGKYLWDERGSQLFDEITRLPAYYATSTETKLLAEGADDLAKLIGPDATIVELGSGATHKIAPLLDVLETPRRFIGIDISADFTAAAVARLRARYPSLEVKFVEADFSRELPDLPLGREGPVLGFLLGCTICNMMPAEAVDLMARLRRALGDGFLMIGQDTTHDATPLQAAYGNPTMAALHCNVLARLRRELGASVAPEHFRHEARVLDAPRRMEAHLVASEPTEIAVAGRVFGFAAGDSIRTDLSVKYAADAFADLARSAGWSPVRCWRDREQRYGLHLLRSR